jgi:hypothetical protein
MLNKKYYSIFDINDGEVDELIQDSVDFEGLKEFIRNLWENDDTSEAESVFIEVNHPSVQFGDLRNFAIGCGYDFKEDN